MTDFRVRSRRRSAGRWRKSGVRSAAKRYGKTEIWPGGGLRTALFTVLAMELLVGIGTGIARDGSGRFRFLRQEELCVVEWVEPGQADNGACEEIYGMRFKADTLELQLYHRQEKLLP